MARLYLVGGPCHGEWIDPGDVSGAPETIVCRGYLYRFDGGTRYYAVGKAASGQVAIPHKADAFTAFRKLQTVLARDVPKYVARSKRARARLRRISR